MSNEAFELSDRLAELAANALEQAIELLDEAEEAIMSEERKHEVPSPKQHTAANYASVAAELENKWKEIMGRPRIQVLSSTVTSVKTWDFETGGWKVSKQLDPATGKLVTV